MLIEFGLKHTSSLALQREQFTVKFRIGYSLFAADSSSKEMRGSSNPLSDADRKVSIVAKILKFKDQEKY